MHFRHSPLEGNVLGAQIAQYVCDNYFLESN
jgi:hypothetical protein